MCCTSPKILLYYYILTQLIPPSQLSKLLLEAESDTGGVAVIGNYLWPNTVAVSGTDDTLQRVAEMAKERRVKTKRINVAGAFHSPLMADASTALHRVMGNNSSQTLCTESWPSLLYRCSREFVVLNKRELGHAMSIL